MESQLTCVMMHQCVHVMLVMVRGCTYLKNCVMKNSSLDTGLSSFQKNKNAGDDTDFILPQFHSLCSFPIAAMFLYSASNLRNYRIVILMIS